VPLLGDIPFLGQLFTSTTQDRISTEVVLTITPRVVRNLGPPPIASQAFWSGTENTYATSQLFIPYPVKKSQSMSSVGKEKRTSEQAKTEVAKDAPGNSNPATSPVPQPQVPPASDTSGTQTSSPLQPPTGQNGSGTTQGSPSGSPRQAGTSIALPSDGSQKPLQPLKDGVSMAWSPSEVSAGVSQDVRLDIVASNGGVLKDTMVTVSFDPQAVEFRRIGPGAAPVSARTLDGQVLITMGRQAPKDSSDVVLAAVYLAAKQPGDHQINMSIQPLGQPASSESSKAVLHVK
jgi:hypothetical protein